MDQDRALVAEREIGRIHAFFPILRLLGNRWAVSRPWEGRTIGLNLHLTPLTAALVRELRLGGGTFVLSAANPGTTDPGAVAMLRNSGVDVYTGGDLHDRHRQVLGHGPDILADTGFDLLATLFERSPEKLGTVQAGIEITRTGIRRLRELDRDVPFPIVNINDGRLKDAIENRHGVGEGVWQAVCQLTGMHLAGRRVVVVGYGPVGRGIAEYARAANMSVVVVEHDPVRRLFAHQHGYPTADLVSACAKAGIIVTATGASNVVTIDALRAAPSGVVVFNAGRGRDEIDFAALKEASQRIDHVADQVVRYRLEDGSTVTLLGGGNPLNIVLNAGSPEPVLLHFAVLGLTLEWLARFGDLDAGECIVPLEIEERAAQLALEALDPGNS
jgi:adenosylhomocysteinase